MNFYDEAIDAKNQLQVDLVQRQRELRQILNSSAVKNVTTPDLANAAIYKYDIAALEEADPYFWNPRLTQLVLASGQQLPDTATFESSWLRGRAGYWWFGRSSPLIGVSEGQRKYVNALLWNLNPNGSLSIQTYCMDGRAQRSLGALTWDEGETLASATASAGDIERLVKEVPDLTLREIALRLQDHHAQLAHEMVELDREVIAKHKEVDAIAAQAKAVGATKGLDDHNKYSLSKYEAALQKDLEAEHKDQQRIEEMNAEKRQRLNEWIVASKNALVTFACGSLWLNQKIVTASQAPLSRSALRRLARTNISSKCLVVELRRKEYNSTSSDGRSGIEWAYQWAVRGHWRDQPTKTGTKLIWIHPYIKGPEDKPLKPDAGRVFAVTR